MSIETELTALATNLENIKRAIVDKGGTVSASGGFADIIGAVESIPASDVPTGYVTVKYWSGYEVGFYSDYHEGCTINSINNAKLTEWTTQYNINPAFGFEFSYGVDSQGVGIWTYYDMSTETSVNIPQPEMAATTGIDVTVNVSSWVQLSIRGTLIVDKTSPLVKAVATTEEEWKSFRNFTVSDAYNVTAGGIKIPIGAIYSAVLGPEVTSINEHGFFSRAHNMEIFSFGNSPITSVASGLCGECANLQGEIVLPSTIESFSTYLFTDMTNWTGPLNVGDLDPETVMPLSSGRTISMLYGVNANVPSVTEGIKITGNKRAEWIAYINEHYTPSLKDRCHLVDGGE